LAWKAGKEVLLMLRAKLESLVSPWALDGSNFWSLLGLTRALAAELGEKNVRVNVIVPGYIDTDMTEGTLIFDNYIRWPFIWLWSNLPPVDTQMYSNVQGVAMTPEARSEALNSIPLKRFGQASEIADTAVFLATNQYANNCVLNLDGGLSAIWSIYPIQETINDLDETGRERRKDAQSSSMSIAPSSSKIITSLSVPFETTLDRFELGVSPSNASAAALFLPLVPFSTTVDEDMPFPFVWPLDLSTDFFLLGMGEAEAGAVSSVAALGVMSRLFIGLSSKAVLAMC
jgi:hypothetical protein